MQQHQYPISPLNLNYESSFTDPFFENYLSEQSKKEQPKLQLEIPHGDSSLQFLSPSVLSSYNVGLDHIFQPLLDNNSPDRNMMTPTFVDSSESNNFHFDPQVLNVPFMGIYQPYEQMQQQLPIEKVLPPQEDEEQPSKHSKKEIPSHRVWSTAFKNEIVGDGDVEITIKTRREKAANLVPERLYSSIKYELQIVATGEFVRTLPFLLARIQVVDAQSYQPILKNNKAVTKGENESALTHPPNGPGNLIKGAIKVQFDSSISYHHDKKEVCLEIGFYMNEALDKPIFIKRSVPVKMFARKPNKKPSSKIEEKKEKLSKRKREDEAEQQQPKVQKVKHSYEFSTFAQQLDELVKQTQYLSDEDKQRATSLILSKFGLSIPFVYANSDPDAFFQAQDQQNCTQFHHQF
jgi:hypothetical protein